MTNEIDVSFTGADGDTLAGVIHRPPGPLCGWAVFAHCFTCSKDLRAVRQISRALTKHSIGVLRFDFTGLGESTGEFADTTFSSNVDDLVAACEFLNSEFGAPSILIGHSLGGAAVLAAAGRCPSVTAVATIGAPADPAHVRHLFGACAADIETKGQAEVKLAGRSFIVRKRFLDDLEAQAPEEAIAALDRALLVFHSPQDNTVGIDNARKIYQAARHPKSFVSLDGADHLLTRAQDARYVADVVAAWAARYVDREIPEVAEGTVVVEGRTGLQQRIRAGSHSFIADEPARLGGTETGPTPYDLLLASLGTCTSMTLRMYAERKKWPLEEVKVTLTHKRVHAKDCAECESKKGYVDWIDREIVLKGELDDEQRARMMQIADKCPVHRTLHNEIRVETVLAK